MTKKPKKTSHGGPGRGQGRKEGSVQVAPKKPPKETRKEKTFSFRATPELAAWIEHRAEESGLKPGPFVAGLVEGIAKENPLAERPKEISSLT